MLRTNGGVLGLLLLTGGFLLLLPPAEGSAQTPEGFLFGRPNVTLSFHMGYGVPRAGSDLFQEIDTLYTLGKSDFQAPVFGGSVALSLNNRTDLALQFSYQKSEAWSEYSDFVEELDDGSTIPIEQMTSFTTVPLTLSIRYFLLDRGRQISRFAWIPTRWSPYVGAGVGRVWYQFEQEGDFISFDDYSIWGDQVRSDGWGGTAHLLGGVEVTLAPRWVLTVEGRYSWADAELDRNAYAAGPAGSYEPIDLAGFRGTVGIGVRF